MHSCCGPLLHFFPPESATLDSLLQRGTEFYGQIVHDSGYFGYLGHNHLPNTIYLEEQEIQLQYLLDTYYGPVDGVVEHEAGQTLFGDALYQALTIC